MNGRLLLLLLAVTADVSVWPGCLPAGCCLQADHVVSPAGERLRRRHDAEGHMIYWLQLPADAEQGGAGACGGMRCRMAMPQCQVLCCSSLCNTKYSAATRNKASCLPLSRPFPSCRMLVPPILPPEEEALREEMESLSSEMRVVREARRVLSAVRGEAAQAIQAVRWVGETAEGCGSAGV